MHCQQTVSVADYEFTFACECEVAVHNKFGRVISKRRVRLPAGQLSVEVGGSMALTLV